MTADCGLRGLALLDAAIEHIEAHPETWNQADWRCGSGMCLAGHIADLAGGEWAVEDPEDPDAWLLVATAEDETGAFNDDDLGQVVGTRTRASRLTGLGNETASNLFYGANSLDTIRRIRDDIAAGERS